LIRPEKEISYWEFVTETNIEGNARDMVEQVKRYVFPYFERFPDSDSILGVLKENKHPMPFICTSRDALIAYLTYLRHGRAAAESLGAELLKPLQGKLPKFSRELKEALEKISSGEGK
jgi:hypothetical protein